MSLENYFYIITRCGRFKYC